MSKGFLAVTTTIALLAIGSIILAIGMRLRAPDQGNFDAPLEVLSEVQPFELVDQEGQPFSSEKLKGKVCVVNFFFTQCEGLCPKLSKEMTILQKRFARSLDFHLVSISADPKNDTPENIAAFIAKHNIDTSNWTLLTGDQGTILRLMKDDFQVSTVVDPRLHSDRFLLLDRQLQMRASYSMSDSSAMERLPRGVRRLIVEGRN
ncbi:MAG: cytochrome c oxidase assembly protein [Opitutae bacterium]|nr:cytochrome c oxidase assembly protein [Opitutae bacterium]|tara:strand:+ start:26826 stop:27437 length:612 start_codon:yes stop_codon:yes gene_type:complete